MEEKPDVKLPLSVARLTLEGSNLEVLNEAKAKAGSRVRIVIYGTVSRVEEAVSGRLEDSTGSGSLDVDIKSVNIVTNNDIQELLDDDF